MRVHTPRAATPTLLIGLVAALAAALLVTDAPLPTLPTDRAGVEDGTRAAAGRVAEEHTTIAPPATDRGQGRIETVALDQRQMTGYSSTPAIDRNGRLWVGHLDELRGQVVVTRCPDVGCTSAIHTDVGITGRFGYGLDLATAADGPVLSHVELGDRTDGHTVVLTRCLDGCHAVERTVVERGLDGVTDTAIAVAADGRPVVAYRGADGRLHVARCTDPDCRGLTSVTLTAAGVEGVVGLALDPAGHPIVASRDAATDSLLLVRCVDADCVTPTTVRPDGRGGIDPDVAVGPFGEILVAHKTHDGLELLRCDVTCGTLHRRLLVRGFEAGTFPTLALDDDVPVLAFYDEAQRAPVLLRCLDATCRDSSSSVVDDRRRGGEHLGMALSAEGNPVLTYRDRVGDLLRLTHCPTRTCGTTQTLAAPSRVAIVEADGGTVAVFADPVAGLRVVPCPAGDCADATALAVDVGGVPPVEAVAALGGADQLVVATRTARSDEATVRFCAPDCDVTGPSLGGVRQLLAVHATGEGVEVLHQDAGGAIAVARCSREACGRPRLLGVPRPHATVAVAAGDRAAVAWRDPVSAEVWLVRCDEGCDGAPTVVGSFADAGDLQLATAGATVALAVEDPIAGTTELVACRPDCAPLTSVAGRPVALLAADELVHLLVEQDDDATLWTCNGRCTTVATGLDVGLMAPTIVSADPLRVVGRDANTMHVVTRTCDRTSCETQGLGDSRDQLGVQ